mgnify:CR=1 FL=1
MSEGKRTIQIDKVDIIAGGNDDEGVELPGGVADHRQISEFCKACGGQCCKHFSIISRPGELMRGLLEVHLGYPKGSIRGIKFHVRHICPHLDEEGLCDLWHEDEEKDERPDFCKNFLCSRAKNGLIVIEAGDQSIEIGGLL